MSRTGLEGQSDRQSESSVYHGFHQKTANNHKAGTILNFD